MRALTAEFWRPSTNSAGYRGAVPETEYPSRETALALIAALQSPDWSTMRELDRVASELAGFHIEGFSGLAERCFMVYGYPCLEGVTVARRISDVCNRPSPSTPIAGRGGVAASSNGNPAPSAPQGPSRPEDCLPAAPSASPEGPQTVTYGFTRRV